MIEINELTKRYGSFTAVDTISLSIGKGEIFGFLGVNGAGKTTTLKMLAGILKPSAGSILIDGLNLADEPIEVKRRIGYIPDRPHLYSGLSGREFLYFVSELYGVPGSDADGRIDALLDRYTLIDRQDELVESYSHGMKQRLATCAALVHNPPVLIVDEPMVGLDPHGAKLLKDSFRAYAADGMTIFLSTHSLNVAEEVCHRLAIIHHGRIINQGTMRELKAHVGQEEKDLEDIFLQLTLEDK